MSKTQKQDPRECKHCVFVSGWCLKNRDFCFAMGGFKCPRFTPKNDKK